jgi:hypothetical protein
MLETTFARHPAFAARRARAAGRAALALAAAGLGLSHLRCEGGDYPIAPTACDDWCRVTQRAGCEEDYPEGCVSNCEERAIGRRFPRCEPEWLELTECYRRSPDADFLCVEEESRPRPICIDERVALTACAFPLRGQCLAACLREARDCGRPELACEARCRSQPPGCDEPQRALYACQLGQPADCWSGEDDTRVVSEIPCIAEIGALLECAGVDAAAP